MAGRRLEGEGALGVEGSRGAEVVVAASFAKKECWVGDLGGRGVGWDDFGEES